MTFRTVQWWLARSDLKLDRKQERRVFRRANTLYALRHESRFVDLAWSFALALCWIMVLGSFMRWCVQQGWSLVTFATVPLLFGGCWFLGYAYHRKRIQPFIHEALLEFGYEVCHNCRYWLRGLGDDVKQCPECGATRPVLPPTTCEASS